MVIIRDSLILIKRIEGETDGIRVALHDVLEFFTYIVAVQRDAYGHLSCGAAKIRPCAA